jgi:hypothetical protein
MDAVEAALERYVANLSRTGTLPRSAPCVHCGESDGIDSDKALVTAVEGVVPTSSTFQPALIPRTL